MEYAESYNDLLLRARKAERQLQVFEQLNRATVDLRHEQGILVVFIPRDDDTFASTSHECVHVVSTPDGDWLFNKRLTESGGNTAQGDM